MEDLAELFGVSVEELRRLHALMMRPMQRSSAAGPLLFDKNPVSAKEQDAENRQGRFNIAPTQSVLAFRHSASREPAIFRWGLVPHWAKDPSVGARMINARAEMLAEKPAYRAALKTRRCLIPADGFFEWKKEGGKKQPFFIRMRDDRPFAFAGLWETWEGPDHGYLETCTIITTEPNELMLAIHDRMPAILPGENQEKWLDPSVTQAEKLLLLLKPHPAKEMEAYPVGKLVNKPENDEPDCIRPVS